MLRELSLVECERLVKEVMCLKETSVISRRLYQFLKDHFQSSSLSPILKPIWSPSEIGYVTLSRVDKSSLIN